MDTLSHVNPLFVSDTYMRHLNDIIWVKLTLVVTNAYEPFICNDTFSEYNFFEIKSI